MVAPPDEVTDGMNRALLLACALCAPGLLLPCPSRAAGRQRVAVLDLRAVHGVAPGTTSVLTAIVVDEAARGGLDVVSQADIMTMLGYEKQRRMLGCSDDACLAELGGALGADYVLSGQVGQIGSRHHLSVQLLDARRGKVIGRAARFSERNEDALADAAQQTVRALVAAARQPGALPPAPQAKAPRPDLAPRPPPPVAPPVPPTTPDAAARPGRTSAWIALGAGAALLAGGAAFGVQAKAARADLAKVDWRATDYAATYETKSASARTNALLSNVCWGAGAVSTGLGAWLLWRGRSPAVAVSPAVGDAGAGLVAAGRF
jgi:TolB-like protein